MQTLSELTELVQKGQMKLIIDLYDYKYEMLQSSQLKELRQLREALEAKNSIEKSDPNSICKRLFGDSSLFFMDEKDGWICEEFEVDSVCSDSTGKINKNLNYSQAI